MEEVEIKRHLTTIFRETFSDDSLKVTGAMTAQDVPAWDSLNHINLVVAVEKAFSIRLATREVRSMKNVSDLIELIKRKTS